MKSEKEIDEDERTKETAEGGRTIYSGKDKTLKNNFRVLKVDDLFPFSL